MKALEFETSSNFTVFAVIHIRQIQGRKNFRFRGLGSEHHLDMVGENGGIAQFKDLMKLSETMFGSSDFGAITDNTAALVSRPMHLI